MSQGWPAPMLVAALGAGVFFSSAAAAQPACGQPGVDLVVGDITGVVNLPNQGPIDDATDAVAFGYTLCNNGTAPGTVLASTPQHPVVGAGLFAVRFVDGGARIEQLGQAWVRHEFAALASSLCCVCTPPPGGAGQLGAGCSSTSSAFLAGSSIANTGPKWQVHPWTGAFTFPTANPPVTSGDSHARRIEVREQELFPYLLDGGRLFVEMQSIAPDESEPNRGNNTSYREVTASPGGTTNFFGLAGTTTRGRPVIHAWQDLDPQVRIAEVAVPGEGWLYVGARVTRLGSGDATRWRYEYAVQNVNLDRGVYSLSVPDACPTDALDIAFHGVAYRDGDGLPTNLADPAGTARNYSAQPWFGASGADGVTWSCTPFHTDPNANALRWGTLYSFRFTSAFAPAVGEPLTLGFFKPGTAGQLDGIAVFGLPSPGGGIVDCTPTCLADFNRSGGVTVQDLFDFLESYFLGAAGADIDGSAGVSVQDLLTFLQAFFLGC